MMFQTLINGQVKQYAKIGTRVHVTLYLIFVFCFDFMVTLQCAETRPFSVHYVCSVLR